jgi:hypothetical protein
MSVFTGAVVLTGEGSPKQLDVFPPPDERSLDRGRSLGNATSAIIHRQRVVSPEDKTERQPMPAWGGAGWVTLGSGPTPPDQWRDFQNSWRARSNPVESSMAPPPAGRRRICGTIAQKRLCASGGPGRIRTCDNTVMSGGF